MQHFDTYWEEENAGSPERAAGRQLTPRGRYSLDKAIDAWLEGRKERAERSVAAFDEDAGD